MITFVVWFIVLVGLGKLLRGWTRAIVLTLYVLGSIVVVL